MEDAVQSVGKVLGEHEAALPAGGSGQAQLHKELAGNTLAGFGVLEFSVDVRHLSQMQTPPHKFSVSSKEACSGVNVLSLSLTVV